VGARRRPVGDPQAEIAGRVLAFEQHFTVEDREIGWLEPACTRAADAGQLKGARRRPVGHPQALVRGRVRAIEQQLPMESREVSGVEPRREPNPAGGICAADAGQLEGPRRGPVSHPQTGVARRVSTVKQHKTLRHVSPSAMRSRTA